MAFQPKGSRALRVIIAELAAEAETGSLITFGTMARAIGAEDDDEGRARVRQVISAARPLLLSDHKRALVAVRGQGYRVALAGEFSGIAQDYRRRSDRSISKAMAVIDHAPVNDMTPDELKRYRAVSMIVRALHARVSGAEQRIADLEAAVYGPPRTVVQGTVEKDLHSAAQPSVAEHSRAQRSRAQQKPSAAQRKPSTAQKRGRGFRSLVPAARAGQRVRSAAQPSAA